CIGQLGRPLGDTMSEGFVETSKFRFRSLLRPEIATDGGDVHRLAGPGIIDPEPIHQEGHRLTRLEMLKIEFAYPSACPQREAPAFVTRSRPVFGNKKVENGQPRDVLICSKANDIEPGAVNELRPAIQVGKADEVGRAFDEGDETPLV